MELDPNAFKEAMAAYCAASPPTHYAAVAGLKAAIIAYLEAMDRETPIVIPDES